MFAVNKCTWQEKEVPNWLFYPLVQSSPMQRRLRCSFPSLSSLILTSSFLRLSLSVHIITIFSFFSPLLLPFLHPSSHFPLVSDIRTWRGKRKQVILGLGVGSSLPGGGRESITHAVSSPRPGRGVRERGIVGTIILPILHPVVGLFRESLMKVQTAAHYGL